MSTSRNKKNKILKEAFSTAVYFLIVFAVAAFILKFVGQRSVVDGESMTNTLFDGESVWVNKFRYRFTDPERFDIIVFPYELQKDTYFIKRIIGLPGETVYIDEDGVIYINDEPLEESYGREVILPENRGLASVKVVVGENEYFVMGDNRNNSMDSRYPNVGNIDRDKIIGKAVFRLFPVSSMGGIE